ncbi:hypothetical protein CTAYLR_004458 [Chrysophaeum taylorii]|uniref:Glycosyl transferase 64 domain-containing protein n=1 Tax=Chrysophaeum taylorii TaxID=2483200 RepID=A0AAD7UBU5_9STRA|nr:hypothetical protein CTAYLR_004458 [Chrysophaeum taylorii]
MRSRGAVAQAAAAAAAASVAPPLVPPRGRPWSLKVAACACLWVCGVLCLLFTTAWLHLSIKDNNDEALDIVECVVRVNTFRRDDLLAQFVNHYAKCPCVHEIAVVWSDVERRPPEWLKEMPKVRVERHAQDSLNNRFNALQVPTRPAIFSVDDDIFITCEGLLGALEAWRAAPSQMVGPAPRLIAPDDDHRGFRYLRWWHVWWNGRYSLVLTKVAVFHRDYLAIYADRADPVLREVRAHVDAHRNCEDIAMSFVVANRTRAPPIWVRLHYDDYGQSFASHAGISAAKDHVAVREACIQRFAELFGRFPLVTAHHKTIDARSSWIW